MKRILTAMMTLVLLTSLFLPQTAGASSSGWYVVESTSPRGYAYLYSAASDRDHLSRNLGRYDNGALVYVVDYYGGQDGKYNYCYVRTQDGKVGYMHDYSLRRSSSNASTSTNNSTSSSGNGVGWFRVESTSPRGYAYLYSAASDRDHLSRNLGRYDNGELVYVLNYYGGQDGKYNYCYVQTQDGKVGYMHDYSLTALSGSGSSSSSSSGSTSRPNTNVNQSSLSNLPSLSHQCWGKAANRSLAVYTGPASSYYRTAKGNATIGGGSTVAIYGREGDYYLIKYNGTASGTTVPRFSMIHVNQMTPQGNVRNLVFHYVPIRIADGAHVSDSPDYGHEYAKINVNGNYAYALAQIQDSAGRTWVYFESTGYSTTTAQPGYVSVRGFVPLSAVSLR
ncbi:MAG: hypothetical protein E7318_05555 [Clostridiales bacterium]|nr:hypothetical protein [Clostridiales bacterium]